MSSPRKKNGTDLENRTSYARVAALLVLLGVGFWALVTLWSPYPQELATLSTTARRETLAAERFLPVNFNNPSCLTYNSQHGEDLELFVRYWAFPEVKRDGIFLELGALDGQTFSNSDWYEKCLGWTGVLIEGHPVAAFALRNNRPNAISFEAAACEKDEGNITFVGAANGLSGDINQMPDEFIQAYHKDFSQGNEEVHVVQCRRISTMLEEAGVDHIDFWTLDVEGAEFTVLTSFDWARVAVHVLVIENDKDENLEYKRRHDLLTSKGMMYVGPLYNNELWVNPNYPNIVFPSSTDQN